MTVDRSTETRISSGSSDCEAKALTVMPCIRPAAVVVITVTPLAKWPIAWRKDALSGGWFTPIRYGNVRRRSPGSAILRDVRLLQSEIYEILHSVRIRDPRDGAPGARLWPGAHLAGRARRTRGPATVLPGADRRPAASRRAGDQPDGRQGRLRALSPVSCLAEGGGPGECTHADTPCSAHAFWERLQGTITSTLESVTVADLMKEAQPA